MDQSAINILLSSLTFLAVYLYARRQRGQKLLPLPPGPRKLPLLGNIFDLPTCFEWETFQEWGKTYNSDIVHCKTPGISIVILNSFQAVNDLLDKRSAIYSDRPRFAVVNRVMDLGWLLPFVSYGSKLKSRRRFFQRHLSPSSATIYKPLETEYTRSLLWHLLDSPQDFSTHLRHSIGGILHAISYGLKSKSVNDPYISLAEQVIENLSDASIPAWLAFDAAPSLIPLLSPILRLTGKVPFNLPSAYWKDLAERFRELPFKKAKEAVKRGSDESGTTLLPSLATTGLLEAENDSDEDVMKDTAGVVFVGGSGTTNVLMQTFILAMMCFPEVQRKAQAEIDSFLQQKRLPELGDEGDLPYVTAILREVQRWRPAGPLAIPHALEKDDVYKGYFLPGGSIVLANVWALMHNEREYPNPSAFNPDRFLSPDGRINSSVRDPASVGFGFGRRVCPGIHIALSTMWITIASILAAFEIRKPQDEHGRIIEPSMAYHSSITFAPTPFKCEIVPRSAEMEALVRAHGPDA